MSVRSASFRAATALLLTLFLAAPASAITDEEYFRNFRFNFGNPGARALAMGGAFIAIADDATATQANPARIALLRNPEFFAEVRRRETDPTTTDSGTIGFSNVNRQASIDLGAEVSPDDITNLSDMAVVWPFTIKNKHLSVSLSRQELVAVRSESTNRFVLVPENASPFPTNPQEQVITSGNGSIDADIALWNLAGGFELTQHLFIGGSIVVGQGSFTGRQESFFQDAFQLTTLGGLDPRFQDPNMEGPLLTTEIQDETDTDLKWSFGIFWTANDYLAFGASYKKGVELEFNETVIDETGGNLSVPHEVISAFNVPDVSGLGISYRPFARSFGKLRSNLLFALDIVRVENEDLVEGFVPQLNALTLQPGVKSVEYTADNQTEIHLGTEFSFNIGRSILFLRGGFYTDPDNNIRLVEAEQGTNRTDKALNTGEVFPARDDETHITGGLGFAISDFELALAYDQSDIETQSLISIIYRLRR